MQTITPIEARNLLTSNTSKVKIFTTPDADGQPIVKIEQSNKMGNIFYIAKDGDNTWSATIDKQDKLYLVNSGN